MDACPGCVVALPPSPMAASRLLTGVTAPVEAPISPLAEGLASNVTGGPGLSRLHSSLWPGASQEMVERSRQTHSVMGAGGRGQGVSVAGSKAAVLPALLCVNGSCKQVLGERRSAAIIRAARWARVPRSRWGRRGHSWPQDWPLPLHFSFHQQHPNPGAGLAGPSR